MYFLILYPSLEISTTGIAIVKHIYMVGENWDCYVMSSFRKQVWYYQNSTGLAILTI